MDRTFYSEPNINGLYHEHIKLLLGVKLSFSFVKKNLEAVYNDIRMFMHFDEPNNIYGYIVTTDLIYSQETPYKDDVNNENAGCISIFTALTKVTMKKSLMTSDFPIYIKN